jgi:hypothetical protein
MPVFDQYEVEPASSYSGSYTDNAFFGDVIVNTNILSRGYTQLGQPNPNTSRRVITSKITGEGTTSPTINRMWMPGYLFEGYASGSFLGRCQRFQSFFSNEYWYDSYVPNAIDIYLQNGGKLNGIVAEYISLIGPAGNETSGSNFDIRPFPNLIAGGGERPSFYFVLVDKYSTVAPAGNVDTVWSSAFPYESRYKLISKLDQFSTRYPTTYEVDRYFAVGPVTPVSYSNEIGMCVIQYQDAATTNFNLYIGAMASPTLPYPTTGVGATFKVGTINPYTFYNIFFGIGNGGTYTKSGVGENQIWWPATLGPGGNVVFISYVVPRGYKHGIRSVAPEQTKITYRVGRYGQNRDMLEGRPYTATLIAGGFDPYTGAAINRTLDYPLQINYVTGTLIYSQSIDYVTATNPSYNPYDSGIYDIYYRSGQPFFDRPNED